MLERLSTDATTTAAVLLATGAIIAVTAIVAVVAIRARRRRRHRQRVGSLLGLRSRIIAAAAIGTVDDALCADLGEFDRDHPETATAVVAGVLSIVDTSLDELVERSGMRPFRNPDRT